MIFHIHKYLLTAFVIIYWNAEYNSVMIGSAQVVSVMIYQLVNLKSLIFFLFQSLGWLGRMTMTWTVQTWPGLSWRRCLTVPSVTLSTQVTATIQVTVTLTVDVTVIIIVTVTVTVTIPSVTLSTQVTATTHVTTNPEQTNNLNWASTLSGLCRVAESLISLIS